MRKLFSTLILLVASNVQGTEDRADQTANGWYRTVLVPMVTLHFSGSNLPPNKAISVFSRGGSGDYSTMLGGEGLYTIHTDSSGAITDVTQGPLRLVEPIGNECTATVPVIDHCTGEMGEWRGEDVRHSHIAAFASDTDSKRYPASGGRGVTWERTVMSFGTPDPGDVPTDNPIDMDYTIAGRPPDPNQTKECDIKNDCPTCSKEPMAMARYSIHMLLASLHIEDTPISYNSPRGPSTDFKVSYNQREANQPRTFNYSNLGPKWTFNWLSYVTDNGPTATDSPTVYVRGGGTEVFSGYESGTGTYAPHKQTLAVLERVNNSKYEKRFPDGSKEVFSKVDGTSYPRRIFLTSVVDASNNETTLTYDPTIPRLRTIIDSLGQPTTLGYSETGDIFKIRSVTDPFERSATFWYTSGELTKIIDPIGIESEFEYESGSDFINKMITPYGATTFVRGESGTSVRWLEATDPPPLLGKQRVEYNYGPSNILSSEASAPAGVHNQDLQYRNTFYWDKKAMADMAGSLDYSKAHVTHWLLSPDGQIVSGIKSSEKKPLESRVWYTYENQSDPTKVGQRALPIKVSRIVGNGNNTATQLYQYEYNDMGKLTKSTDPLTRVTTYSYDSNHIDLLDVRQTTSAGSDLLQHFESYYLHKPMTVVDAAGQSTGYVYNSYGQILTRTNPPPGNEVTTFTYDRNDDNDADTDGYLHSIESPSGMTIFEYEDANVHTVTNVEDNYTVTTDYDEIDRKTKVTYPDGTHEDFEYTQDFGQGPATKILDLTVSKDRLGRSTVRHYNTNRQMDAITDPLLRTTQYDWCSCGSLTGITDPNGNATTFIRDLQSRVTSKVFVANNTAYTSAITYSYETATSRLSSMTDALNQKTNYQYKVDDNLAQVSYANALNPTPTVDYEYEPDYNRIYTVTAAGTGTITYTYYSAGTLGAGKVETIGGLFANDTITYTYDSLGRQDSWSIGSITEAVAYDEQGRPTTTNNDALGSFERRYEGVSLRLERITYPNGQRAKYTYSDSDHDFRLQTIENLATGNVSRFDYDYDPEGQLKSWGKMLGATASGLWFDYDDARQLQSARNASTIGTATEKVDYNYDDAGNRIYDRNYNPNGAIGNGVSNTYGINVLNQVESRTVAVGGVSLEPQGFVYDAAGNMSSDGADKTFEWDAANRLIAINYVSTGNRTEFAYDGLGRRVKITEYGPGMTADIEPVDANYARFGAGNFTLPSGGFTITLQGLNPFGSDSTMLVDSVKLNSSLLANGSFEDTSVTDYQVAPTGASWSFSGTAGVAANGLTYGNPSTTAGTQAAFIRNHGSLSQSLSLAAGTYKLELKAAQRSGNETSQRVRVIFRSPASVTSSKTLVWCGNQICQEREGATVTKRFFAQGEQRIEGAGPVNYYYTRDHLGSIREVLDSNGQLLAQYDYDPYGNRVVLSGQMYADFGYTGHYFHAPSGLNLTLYRAYNPAMGRWLSRDPIGENGGSSESINLYEYVLNDPVNQVDTLGLQPKNPTEALKDLLNMTSRKGNTSTNNTYALAYMQCEMVLHSPTHRCKCCVIWILSKHTFGDNVESKGAGTVYDKPCSEVRYVSVYSAEWTAFTFYIPW